MEERLTDETEGKKTQDGKRGRKGWSSRGPDWSTVGRDLKIGAGRNYEREWTEAVETKRLGWSGNETGVGSRGSWEEKWGRRRDGGRPAGAISAGAIGGRRIRADQGQQSEGRGGEAIRSWGRSWELREGERSGAGAGAESWERGSWELREGELGVERGRAIRSWSGSWELREPRTRESKQPTKLS